jgi:hypothetical protein
MDLTLRQELERMAEREKTSFSNLVSAICSSYLKTVRKEPAQAKESQAQQAIQESTDGQPPDKYLSDLQRQWPTLSQEQREAHMRIIARDYGPHAQEFLQGLGGKP